MGVLRSIRLLPEATRRLIRAGETIDAVAAVVRELVDNALDAEADRIEINYWPERWQIQVSDNGWGMAPEDLEVAAHCHTTSKIYETGDLFRVESLGFRGEGLFALSAVSDLEIASRMTAQAVGWRATYDETGAPLRLEPCGLAVGTLVTVRNLFSRLPVRQRFLSPRKESLNLYSTLRRIALAQPQVSLNLLVNDRPRLTFLGVTSPARRLGQVLGWPESDLRTVVQHWGACTLHLVLGLPDRVSRPRADGIFIGVNGRLVDDPDLSTALQQSFSRMLPRGRHPVVLAHWHLPPEQVDWNRHPAKQTVHLGERPQLEEYLRQAVRTGLGILEARPGPEIFKVAEERATYRSQESAVLTLKAVAQVQNTYILAEHPEGVWLVEQHVCHERVLFEQLSQVWEVVVSPTYVLPGLNLQQVTNLEQLGLDLELFGEGVWAVRSLPRLLANLPDPRTVLWELSLRGELESARVTLACRMAIKNGTPLTLDAAQDLLNQWQSTTNPHTCPHGRPIYLSLTSTDLGQYFRRRWRICDNSEDAVRERLSDKFPNF
ncbi:DNA mismatch repair endonuclease MutL [Anthocerotibacter panamensis]|uniref:DNA mismatch repair endonuclease MutL n=1 Tax=Anthocerotibacter panamensis TaxID=2857077 RepID=UPI001C406724|nr:DNA mismatch repair endonuclease MutL [Anthocerotibacter panamensis]